MVPPRKLMFPVKVAAPSNKLQEVTLSESLLAVAVSVMPAEQDNVTRLPVALRVSGTV
jgi:hypothetical protein